MKRPEIPPFIVKWEEELGKREKDQHLGEIVKMVHSTAIDSNTIEMNYKCLLRWYIRPDETHNIKTGYRGFAGVGATLWEPWPTNGGHVQKCKKYWKEVL